MPTFRQLEDFARTTHTPLGYFFLAEPPLEQVPIPDLRTIGGSAIARPSANLLDTVYMCQQRQDWYRHHAKHMGDPALSFVASVTIEADPIQTASDIRATLMASEHSKPAAANDGDALRTWMDRADALGIMVMVSGIVGNNTHRPLDIEEFRGFALADSLAPIVFINGADTKAGQLFTLAHEIAHIWAGESALTNITPASSPRAAIERWCNAVAAEVLVPMDSFRNNLRPDAPWHDEVKRLARACGVSTLVILRRMRDAGRITRDEHTLFHEREARRLRELVSNRQAAGGNFYHTAQYRLSPRFASAVLTSTYEGRSTFTEAFRLLGCRNTTTLDNIAHSLGLSNPTMNEPGTR